MSTLANRKRNLHEIYSEPELTLEREFVNLKGGLVSMRMDHISLLMHRTVTLYLKQMSLLVLPFIL